MTKLFFGTADFVKKFFPSLKLHLLQAGMKEDERTYIAKAISISISSFIFLAAVLSLGIFFSRLGGYSFGFSVALGFSAFIFLQKMVYPSIRAGRRIKDIERNLLPVLQSIYVQINSGITLFEVFVNISKADYGEISKEFKRVVSEINAGKSQVDSLEDLASRNPSKFFRSAMWQIINGMKGGADISDVIQEANNSFSEEQIIQIQGYGSKLAPLAMFYMMIAIILPALSVTFLILFLSFSGVSEFASKAVFAGFYLFFLIFQVVFMGLISTRRPNLL